MRLNARPLLVLFAVLPCLSFHPAWSADAEVDALNLESAPEESPKASAGGIKFFAEMGLGMARERYDAGSRDLGRLSLDLTHTTKIVPGLRATFSNRLDYFHPRQAGVDRAVNSLREAYLSWQPDADQTVLEFGRINLRYGPGYGYNPTDFFRDGSLRVLTNANPFALRENRLGTVMLRAQRLWAGGSFSFAYSPKLANVPSTDGWSLDLGSTNHQDRILLALSTQWSESLSSQLLLYKPKNASPTVGASMTGLLSDAAVMHLEWSAGKEPDLLNQMGGVQANKRNRSRLAAGLTYTTGSKLSLTGEYQYNGFALSRDDWNSLTATSAQSAATYLGGALRMQELASRQAYLVYATQKDWLKKDLNLTAFLRVNTQDHSRLAWMELRHHWTQFDLAIQLQQHSGAPASEYGVLRDRRLFQVLGAYYF